MKRHIKGISWMLAFALVDATILNVVRYVAPYANTFQILCVGNIVAATLCAIWVYRAKTGFKTSILSTHLARVGFETVAATMMFASLVFIPAAEVKSIMSLTPIFASIAAIYFLGENNTPAKWTALLAGFVGVLIILRPGTEVVQVSSFMPLVASLFFCAGITLLKRASGIDPPMRVAFYFTSLQGFFSLPLLIAFWQPLSLLAIGLLTLLGSLFFFAHLTITNAMRHAPLVAVAPFMFVGIIFTAIIGLLVHNEFPTINVFVGAAIIIGAVIFIAHHEARNDR